MSNAPALVLVHNYDDAACPEADNACDDTRTCGCGFAARYVWA